MNPKCILTIAFLVTLAACNVFNSSDDFNSELLGAWYNIENLGHDDPSPEQRVTGWFFSDENQAGASSLGAVYPIGIDGSSGQVALIDSRFTPSIEPQIHKITSDKIILDYIGYLSLAKSTGSTKTGNINAVSDISVVKDTVKYTLTPTKLILDGRYYKGTYNRTTLGNKLSDPVKSEFKVSINGNVRENLKISETTPSAYISKRNENDVRIISRMGWHNIIIDIAGFHGPGTYILGKTEASVTPRGFDTLSPSYVTVADSSGYVIIEQIDPVNGNVTGIFEFTSYMGGSDEEFELSLSLRNGSFDLPLFE